MYKKNKIKAIVALAVALAFVLPGAAFANDEKLEIDTDTCLDPILETDICPDLILDGKTLDPGDIGVLDPGDILFEYNVQALSGDFQCTGVEFDGTYFYVTGGGAGGTNKIHFFQANGTYITSVNQGTTSGFGWRDIGYDGNHMYSGDESGIVEWYVTGLPDNPVLNRVGNIPGPLETCRAMAYDPVKDHFWTADWDSHIYEFERNGNIVNYYPNSYYVYGMAWDNVTPNGPWLWIYSQNGPNPFSKAQVLRFDPINGVYTGTNAYKNGWAGGACFIENWEGKAVFVGLSQDIYGGPYYYYDMVFGMECLENPYPETIVWEYSWGLASPAEANRLENGNTLITDTGNNRIIEVAPNNTIVWQYNVSNPKDAERLENGNTLITYQRRVIEVAPNGTIVWQYSTGGQTPCPYDADRLGNGNTLIAGTGSNFGESLVREVGPGGIVWEYGGFDDNFYSPKDADYLGSDNILMVGKDEWTNNHIIVVHRGHLGDIVTWDYGTGLSPCYDADRLENGNTLITIEYFQNDKIIEVDPNKNIVWETGFSIGLDSPKDADRLANGNTLIADTGNDRIIEVSSHPSEDYTLTINIEGNGTVTKDPDYEIYDYYTAVTLTAIPDDGWLFDSWDGDLTGSDNPEYIRMTGNKTVMAIFIETPEPDLDCEGEFKWEDVKPGDIVEGSFTVSNIGEPDSLLNWEVKEWPDWGNWSFDPESGTGLPEGDSVPVNVEVIAPDEENTEFTGEIVLVNSDDPDDTCIIEVMLVTPCNLDIGRVWLRGLLFRCNHVGNVNNALALRLHYIEFTPTERGTGTVMMNRVIFKDPARTGRMYEFGAGLFTYVIGFFEGGLEIL